MYVELTAKKANNQYYSKADPYSNNKSLTGLNCVNISCSLCSFNLSSTSGPDSTLSFDSPAARLLLPLIASRRGNSPAWSK